MKGQLSEFAIALGGELHGADGRFDGASIDTRGLSPDVLFFALSGDKADGHAYVGQAAELGAAGAVVARPVESTLPQIVVADVEHALQRAAQIARAGFAGPVVGVTGSNGKTTVKQMIASIFSVAAPVLATEGNLNNHLGVPLTLMRLDANVERAVIEMGANHPGEIARLTEWARPEVGVITNAGWAHIEGFGSREGIARAKGELFSRLPDDGIAVINADDEFADFWREHVGRREVICFSTDAAGQASVYAEDIQLKAASACFMLVTPTGRASIEMALAGQHNIANALAAAAVAVAVGLDVDTIAQGLAGMAAVGGRLMISPACHDARLVDDSYNANPGSLAAALDWLSQQSGQLWAALGDMGELGEFTESAHRDAGVAAREAGIKRLFVTGPHSRSTAEAFGEGALWFADHDALNTALFQALATADAAADIIILVKGSRSARMDRVAGALKPSKRGITADNAGSPC